MATFKSYGIIWNGRNGIRRRCPQRKTDHPGDSEPEADAAVVKGAARDYTGRHPISADTELIAEVADSSLAQNRKVKMQAYAAAGIACHWIVDLVNRRVEVHTNPQGQRYVLREVFATQVPICISGRTPGQISVAEIPP
jgi:hypothetical protein